MSQTNLDKAYSILKNFWGYDQFREPQEEIMDSILQGFDTIALLPTGGGKSLCYQIPALISNGKVLVVSPLVSLMLDQVKALNKIGVSAKALHSGLHSEEIDRILDNFVHGPLKLLYVSPERINTEQFQVRFYMANVSFIAIDEAHCISQWGHDFRPSYLKISMLRELKPDIPVIALTATATQRILADIAEQLYLNTPQIFTKSFARENISFSVIKTEDKMHELLSILQKLQGSSIIYMRNRTGCVKVAELLLSKKISATYYHAGLSHEHRQNNQEKWMQNKARVMVATNAFGMGIDKKDVRIVIHMDIPSSIEDYYQEAGRAGRDHLPSYAIALINNGDVHSAHKIYDYSYPDIKEMAGIYHALCRYLTVAVGNGAGNNYFIDFDDFCTQYNINIYKCQSTIKILEKQGWIVHSEGLRTPAKIMMIGQASQLYNMYKEDDVRHLLLVQLLRNYEGLFDDMIAINIRMLSMQLNIEMERIVFLLKVMQNEGVLYYNNASDLPEIVFVLDRPDERDFRLDEKSINAIKNEALKRLNSTIEYFTGQHCRQQVLLEYFGEKANECGRCDVCRGSFSEEYTEDDRKKLVKQLMNNSAVITIPDILSQWPLNKRKRITRCLEEMRMDGFIELDNKGSIIRKNI